MLKNIRIVILACVFALTPAHTASGMYEEICFEMKVSGIAAKLWHQRVEPSQWAEGGLQNRGWETKVTGNIAAHSSTCVNPADVGIEPGYRYKFSIDPIFTGKRADCTPHNDNKDTHPKYWLMPDGPVEGKLVFRGGGSVFSFWCSQQQPELRLHSSCTNEYNGLEAQGCRHALPDSVPTDILHWTIRRDDGIGFLGAYMKKGLDPDRPAQQTNHFGEGNTPLHIAAWLNRTEYARALIDHAGADPSRVNTAGHDPLMLAIIRGHPNEMAIDLLSRGANPNTVAENGDNALALALASHNEELLRELVRYGVNLNGDARNGGEFPLYIAARDDDAEAVRLLLAYGANPDLTGPGGDFPLYIAAREGSTAAARELIAGGANVNRTHENGKTAIRIANDAGSAEIVTALREANAEEGVYDAMVYDIVELGGDPEKLQWALTEGADVNHARRADRRTALHLAAAAGNQDYVRILVHPDHNADLNAQDAAGRTPLLTAVSADLEDIWVLRALLGRRADPNMADNAGNFPLYAAVENGRLDLVQLLVSADPDINQCHTATNLSARMRAEELSKEDKGFDEIHQFLIRRGAAAVAECGG